MKSVLKRAGKKYSSTLILFFLLSTSYGQDDIFGIERKIKGRKSESAAGNVFRNAISNFSFELGSGFSYHRNEMSFFSETADHYPIQYLPDSDLPVELAEEETTRLGSGNFAIPVHAGVRINVFNIFTIGGGYGRELGRIDHFTNPEYSFAIDNSAYTFDKIYGSFGLVLYDASKRAAFLRWRYRKFSESNIYMQSEKNQRIRQDYPWRFILEGDYGRLRIRDSYDERLSADEPFYAVGFRIEREFSEYTKIFIRPSYEMRNLVYAVPDLGETQNIRQSLYSLNIGVAINLPGTKRCKVSGCGVVMKHSHNGVEYRGSSIWNMQNRKVGQWY